jgi:hypothetical protein
MSLEVVEISLLFPEASVVAGVIIIVLEVLYILICYKLVQTSLAPFVVVHHLGGQIQSL